MLVGGSVAFKEDDKARRVGKPSQARRLVHIATLCSLCLLDVLEKS